MATQSVSHSAGPTLGDQDLARHRALPNSVIDPMGHPWAKELRFIGVDDPANEPGFAADQTPTMVDFRERVLHGIVLVSNCLQIQDTAATLTRASPRCFQSDVSLRSVARRQEVVRLVADRAPAGPLRVNPG